MAFKVGDMVIRTSGSWRGVNEGDINKVTSVWGGNISLAGYDDITFDGDNFELHETAVPVTGPREFKVGDRVRMIAESPRYGRGEVRVGDIGVITSIPNNLVKYKIKFERQDNWSGAACDIEHEFPEVAQENIPQVSLDEAVENWQSVSQQIKELQAQVVQYERIMRSHGVRPV